MNAIFTPWGLMTWPDTRGQRNVLFHADGLAGPFDESAPMTRDLMEPMRWARARMRFEPFWVVGGFVAGGEPRQVPLLGAPPGATIN